PTEYFPIRRHMSDRREWQVRCSQELSRAGQVLEQTNANARRLFRVVFESIVPSWLIEPDREHRVPREGQCFTIRIDPHHAVAGSVTTCAAHANPGSHLTLVIKGAYVLAVLRPELLRSGAQRIRKSVRHIRAREIWRLPELHFRGGDVNLEVRIQTLLDSIEKQTADMIHMHVGDHHVSHFRQVNAGCAQASDQLAGARQMEVRIRTKTSIDQN